jgi:hypothetical protein
MTPEKKLVEMETNYPRLEQPDRNWIGKFFWNSAWFSGGIATFILFFVVRFLPRPGKVPFHTDGNRGVLQFTFGEYGYGLLLLIFFNFIIFTTSKGFILASRSQSIFTHLLPRMLLLCVQVIMFMFSLVIGSWLAH